MHRLDFAGGFFIISMISFYGFDELEVACTRVNKGIDDVPNGNQNDNK